MNRRYGCFLLEREVTQKVLLVVHLATHEADHRNPLASTGLVVPPDRTDLDSAVDSAVATVNGLLDQIQRVRPPMARISVGHAEFLSAAHPLVVQHWPLR